MDGKSSDGGAPETSQPKGLFGESKTSPTGQETRSRSKTPTRFQKVWQSKMFVLHIFQQHQDPHQHPDWTNVANKAIHHLRGRQCCLLCHLLPWCWTVPRKPAQYIGKVGPTRPCRVRCTEHRGAVNHHWDTGVGEHFNLPGHDLANFNFLPFEKVRSSDPFVVETRESYWIEKYGVLGEGGMNRRS